MQILVKSQLSKCMHLLHFAKNFSIINNANNVYKNSVRTLATAYSGSVKPGKYSYLSVPGELPLSSQTLGELVDTAAARFGTAEALYEKITNSRLSFEDVKIETDKLAAGFLKLGFQPGDRVGIWGPNSREWYMVEMALAKAGLVSVYVNPAYQTREVLYCLNKVSMKGVIIAGQFKTQNYYEMMVETVPELSSAPAGQIKSSNVPSLTTVISMEQTAPGSGTLTYNQVLDDGTSKDALSTLSRAQESINADDICNIQFTSGTTGNPKGVMLTHHNIVNNSMIVGKRFHLTAKDKLCLPVPLFHCYGNVTGVLAALHYGCSIVFPSPGFDPKAALQVASEEQCTVMYGTPTMHIDMLNVPELEKHNLSSLRKAVTAGAICPEELIRKMKVHYTIDSVDSLYGLTETSPVFFQSLPTDSDDVRAATVGYPQEHTEVKIIDSQGKVVPVGTQGEMCARGYMVMRGYWEDPEKTKEAIDETRWFHTGDLFIMEPSGHGRIVGRIKDMIIRGGENIYPREIEEFLNTHPKIIEPHVFGVPDKRLGETVAVWIRLKDGETMTVDEVREFCKGKISHYKIPHYIEFTSEFPKTTSGKIQKFKMREITLKKLELGN